MNPKQIAKQMISFNKTAFDNNFSAMKALHEQTERIVNKFWEKSPMFPEEGKKAISDWMKAYKKGCDDFKTIVDENFKKVDDFFNEPK
jgi:polyhydroxyalkanoate synthesis regulator phasin